MAVAAGIALPLLVILSSRPQVPLVCLGQKQPEHVLAGRHLEEGAGEGGRTIARALTAAVAGHVSSPDEHEAAAAVDHGGAGHDLDEAAAAVDHGGAGHDLDEAAGDVREAPSEAIVAEIEGAATEQAEEDEPGGAGGFSEHDENVGEEEEGEKEEGNTHGDSHGEDHEDSHGEGHGHGHGEHGQRKGWRSEYTIAFMLLGFVGFNMALFYLVNWHDPDIRENSWKIISGTISIFCAVLTFQSLESISADVLKNQVVNQMLLFFLLWFLTQILLYNFRSNPFPLKAFGTIGGHIVGFAALHAFGAVQAKDPFKSDVLLSTMPLVAYVPTAVLLMLVAYWFREYVAKIDDTVIDEDERRWIEQCEDTENDANSLGTSFLLVGVLKCLISGEVPDPHHEELQKGGMAEGIAMSLAGVAFLAVVAVFAIVLHKIKRRCPFIHELHKEDEDDVKKHTAMRIIHIVMDTSGLSMAWCFLAGGDMLLDETIFGDRLMMADLALSLLFSIGAMGMIFVLDFLADNRFMPEKALRGMIVALSLLVGLAWESCFKVAVDDVAFYIGGRHPAIKKYAKLLIAVVLVGVVLPAWRLYILPQSDPELAKTYRGGHPPARPPALKALCCGRMWQVTQTSELQVLERPGGNEIRGKTVSSTEPLQIEQERIVDDILYLKIKNSGWVAERDQAGRVVCTLKDTVETGNHSESSSLGSEDDTGNDSQSDDYKSDETTKPMCCGGA